MHRPKIIHLRWKLNFVFKLWLVKLFSKGGKLSNETKKMEEDAEYVSNYVSKWTPAQNVLDPVVVQLM